MSIVADPHNRPLYLFPQSAMDKPEDPLEKLWLDVNHFRVFRVELREELCRPFFAEFDVWASDELLRSNPCPVWIWKSFDLFLETGAETVPAGPRVSRRLRGLATRVSQRGKLRIKGVNGSLIRLGLEPDLVVLRHAVRSRVHGGLLSSILSGLLKGHPVKGVPAPDFDIDLGEGDLEIFQKTQYEESDLDFLTRLAEEYGVAWHCDWSAEKPRWVFSNGDFSGKGAANPPTYRTLDGNGHRLAPLLTGAQADRQVGLMDIVETVELGFAAHLDTVEGTSLDPFTGKRHLTDRKAVRANGWGLADHGIYPLSRGQQTFGDIQALADRHWITSEVAGDWGTTQDTAMARECARQACAAVSGRLTGWLGGLSPGSVFTLQGDDAGTKHLVRSCRLEASHQPMAAEPGAQTDWGRCVFSKFSELIIQPVETRHFPPRLTPAPRIHGVRMARVVGLSGTPEDHPSLNRFGSVLVRMDWLEDGDDKPNQRWARVCQPWAGNQYGTMFWPRVGNEVAIAFEQGDPDRPIVVGSVYSAWNLPPESADAVPYGWVSGIVSQPLIQGDVRPNMNNFLKIYDDKHCQMVIHSVTTTYDVSSANSFKITDAGMINISGRMF